MPDSTSPVAAITANPDSPADLLARYRRGAAVLRDAIAGLDAAALRSRPIAGKMSSLEVVCHVVDADQYMCDRMKRTIATERPLLIGVESVDYLVPLHYHDRDPELDLRLLEVQREQMAADLDLVPAEAWERSAIHSEVGLLTLRQILAHAVRHLESHIEAIAEKRAALDI
ncbi:MAG TPA: DinB family protein [Coriobacteriia bacterium]